jgi:hypothetical protein
MEAVVPERVVKWVQVEVVDVSIPTFDLAVSMAFYAYLPL